MSTGAKAAALCVSTSPAKLLYDVLRCLIKLWTSLLEIVGCIFTKKLCFENSFTNFENILFKLTFCKTYFRTYFLANIISISFVSILTKQLFLKINSPKKSRTLSLNVTRRKTLSISRSLSATNNNKFHHTLPHRQDSSSSKALIHLKTFFFQKMSHPPGNLNVCFLF